MSAVEHNLEYAKKAFEENGSTANDASLLLNHSLMKWTPDAKTFLESKVNNNGHYEDSGIPTALNTIEYVDMDENLSDAFTVEGAETADRILAAKEKAKHSAPGAQPQKTETANELPEEVVEEESLTDEQIIEMASKCISFAKDSADAIQKLLEAVDGVTPEEAKDFVLAAYDARLDAVETYADESSKLASDAVDKANETEAKFNHLFVEHIALKRGKRMPASEEEIQLQAKLIQAEQARKEREMLPDLESVKVEYPEFPNWVMEGCFFYENHVKPICDANKGARIPHFNFIPGVLLLLNYVGNKIRVELRGWKPALYVVLIGKKGKVKKSSSMNDAIQYFTVAGICTHYSKEVKNANGQCVVWEAGSPEGLGTDMQRINCKNAILFYDELSVLAKKVNIEASTMRDALLKLYESGNFSNSIKSKKDSFSVAPGSYTASLLAGCTKKRFSETYSSLGSGDDGLDDRFSFHLQPEVLERSRPQVYVSTIEATTEHRKLIDRAVNQGMFAFTREAVELQTEALDKGMSDRDEIRAEKYALYFAIDLGRTEIDADCMKRGLAIALYEVAVKKYLRLVETDSKQAQLQIKIRRLLEDAPQGTMTERDLERRANAYRHGTYNWSNAMKGLLALGIIREVDVTVSVSLARKGGWGNTRGYQVMKLIEVDGDDED